MIFQRSNQNKNKRKGEKVLPPQPQTTQGAYVNGFMSLSRQNKRFHCLGNKSRFSLKLREAKMTFSLHIKQN